MKGRAPGSLLYVIGSLDRGGAEGHLAAIAPGLAARGWRVAIYCLEHRGAQAGAVARQGVRVIAPPIEKRPAQGLWRLPPLRRAAAALRLGLSSLKLGGLLVRERPAIAHFFLPGAYLIGAPLALATRRAPAVMSRRCRNHYQARRPLAGRLERILHRRMTALLGNSRRLVRDLLDEGAPPERVGLIYNGVDLGRFVGSGDAQGREAARARLGVPSDGLVFITVANLIPYKGHGDLIDALARIARQLPAPWTLLCVGRDDGIGGDLARQAEARGIAAEVRFLGSRTDVPDLLALGDIAVLASHEEGFSNAVLEAMAAGLPMVVTDVGGNAEAVVHGKTGLVVPPRDPVRLAEALLALARDGERRHAMGRAARRRAEEAFSLEACLARYEALYDGLLEGRTPREIAPVAWRQDTA